MTTENAIAVNASKILDLKAQINDLKQQLTEHEEAIHTRFKTKLPEEGSKTFTEGGFKITLTSKLNRKVDGEKWEKIISSIPPELRPMRIKYEPIKKGLDWLKENKPGISQAVLGCITSKPAKPTITVKEA